MIGIIIWFPNFKASAPPSLSQRFRMITNKQVSATVGITFLTSVASLGLYTYTSSVLHDLAKINNITPYLWAWGIGGVIGSFFIGTLIDRTGRPSLLMAGILTILAVSFFILPASLNIPILTFLPFFLWGATGWASQAPQQHVLLQSQPNNGSAAVALNSSANYLGSSVGSALGGGIILMGLTPSQLPFAAGVLVLVALIGQLTIVLKKNRTRSSNINKKVC